MLNQKTISNVHQNTIESEPSIKHLACMMDGNRRWAKRRGWLPILGHRQGVKTISKVIEFCIENQIKYLSLYTFSLENFKRSTDELNYLFGMMKQEADKFLAKCVEQKINIRFLGDRLLFPEDLKPICERIEKETSHFTTLYVNFLFCYGGRQEIVSGVKKILSDIQAGILKKEDVNESMFSDYLWTSGLPEPDLVLRTGGAIRTSNFLLYQSAYSEFQFLDCYWPELSKKHLEKALEQFIATKRNFGT